LAAQGKAFCAGANFGDGSTLDAQGRRPNEPGPGVAPLYVEGKRLFRTKKPIIAAVHGAAVGGGLGLAMVPDFRVTCPEARFCANFTRLGFHPGFGLTVTLPAAIGQTKAALMLYTSRRVTGEEAYAMALLMCWCRISKCGMRQSSSRARSARIHHSGLSPRVRP
jgi:enoyl-CoA hydratase/carnithine racemase